MSVSLWVARLLLLLPLALPRPFSFPSSPCTPTTFTPWLTTCATPPRGATTATTSPSHSQIWKRWFVKWAMLSYSSYAKQFQKCNAQNAFFIGIKEWYVALVCEHLLVESESSQNFTLRHQEGDPTMLGTAKQTHRKSTMWPTTRGRDVSKEIVKKLSVCRDSQLKMARPRRSAPQWINWHRKTLVGLVGCLLLVEQLLNPIPSSNHFWRKSLEEVEDTRILSRIWSFQSPS